MKLSEALFVLMWVPGCFIAFFPWLRVHKVEDTYPRCLEDDQWLIAFHATYSAVQIAILSYLYFDWLPR